MAHLALHLLGPPRLERDGEPVQIRRRKVMALLVYLAVTGQPHSREALATLLSPEFDTGRARNELRRTLSVLNRLLGAGCLTVDRETVALNPEADLWLDVDRFRKLLAACETHDHPPDAACPDCVPLLEATVELYQDDFLAGFTLPDSLEFEEWGFFQAEALCDDLASALQRLVRWHSEQAEPEPAIDHARRWLALDPLHEPAHRQLMELYARAGRRAAALRQYRACLRALEEELGVPPAPKTTALYERIRAEREAMPAVPATALPSPSAIPAFLERTEEPAEVERRVFVARERELAQLRRFLDAALRGQGGVAFVTGGPGRGKTFLIEEFARRATDAHPDLLVALGNCNAYSGLGDPYLPFRRVLATLTGDVETRRGAGAITNENARRIWDALPVAVEVVLDHGSALIDTFLSGSSLLSRAVAAAPDGSAWLRRLQTLVERQKAGPGDGSTHRPSTLDGAGEFAEVLAQSQLFDGYTDILRALAAQHSLMLVLDDLQWADTASISLLFQLARELAVTGSPILILGAYRPEEVALGRRGERHPLEKVLAEFKRHFGDVWLDLTQADESGGRRFVDALLDSEPNRLGEKFRSGLFQRTGGHPLFTVELLRAMQGRGDLIQDEDGGWTEGPKLDWETLPPRVGGVIEERVGRLGEGLRDILTLASVEGEYFTAQVVSRLGDIPERELLRTLSQELGGRHRLVREAGESQVGGRFLARYRFAHTLFQSHLYNTLSAGERRLLHGEIAETLEALYAHAGEMEKITGDLARHYAEAGRAQKAVKYLLLAGDQARTVYAHAEAIDHYRQALAFLKASGQDAQAARTLMRLGLAYHNAFDYHRARQAYDEGFALWRRSGEGAPTTSMPPTSHTLKLYTYEPRTLDPTLASAHRSIEIINQLFSGLVELTPEMEILPAAAQTWEISADGCQYLFRLRNDVYWSDGVPLTAGDFEYAWKRALDPRTGAALASLLYDIKGARAFHEREIRDPDSIGVRALDAITLQVELEGPTCYYLQLLGSCITYPVPRHLVDLHGPAWTEVGNIVTNGPFKLDAWQPGESMVLSRDSAYRGRFTGNLGQVVLSFPAALNTSTGLRLYEANNLSILELLDLSASELSHARQRHPAEHVSVPTLNTLYVGFDVTRPPFDDRRVRRAFVLASERERLAHEAWGGCFPATGGLVPPGMPGHSAGVGLSYNPEQARQLLAEAGFPDGRGFPEVEALWPDIVQSQGDWLQAHWRAGLGVAVEWQAVDWATYIERLHNAPPPVFFGAWWADYPDPDNFLRASSFRPLTRWHNATYQRLVEEARRIQDQAKRMSLYRQADAILIEEAPIVPLIYRRHDVLVKPWVTQFPVSPMSWWFWKDVIIEPH